MNSQMKFDEVMEEYEDEIIENQNNWTTDEANAFKEFLEEQKSKANAFIIKQQLPYEQKIILAKQRANEFYERLDGNCFISVGGLDSITLLLFLRSIGINVPAISVSSLEDKSIQDRIYYN